MSSVSLYEQTLARTRSMQTALKKQFDDDIGRFPSAASGAAASGSHAQQRLLAPKFLSIAIRSRVGLVVLEICGVDLRNLRL